LGDRGYPYGNGQRDDGGVRSRSYDYASFFRRKDCSRISGGVRQIDCEEGVGVVFYIPGAHARAHYDVGGASGAGILNLRCERPANDFPICVFDWIKLQVDRINSGPLNNDIGVQGISERLVGFFKSAPLENSNGGESGGWNGYKYSPFQRLATTLGILLIGCALVGWGARGYRLQETDGKPWQNSAKNGLRMFGAVFFFLIGWLALVYGFVLLSCQLKT